MLQFAVCCSILQCVAVCCSELQRVAVCRTDTPRVRRGRGKPLSAFMRQIPKRPTHTCKRDLHVCTRDLRTCKRQTRLECGGVATSRSLPSGDRKCCSVLQCVAVCGSMWQCVVVCRSMLQYGAVWCSVVQCGAVRCSALQWRDTPRVLQCVAVYCSVLQCVAVCCRVLQCVAVCWRDKPRVRRRCGKPLSNLRRPLQLVHVLQ